MMGASAGFVSEAAASSRPFVGPRGQGLARLGAIRA